MTLRLESATGNDVKLDKKLRANSSQINALRVLLSKCEKENDLIRNDKIKNTIRIQEITNKISIKRKMIETLSNNKKRIMGKLC